MVIIICYFTKSKYQKLYYILLLYFIFFYPTTKIDEPPGMNSICSGLKIEKNFKKFFRLLNQTEQLTHLIDQIQFKVICGTEPHPVRFRAKKYKVQEKSFSLVEFRNMMSHLPEHVSDSEIEEMFSYADKDNDGKISWEEFLVRLTKLMYLHDS